MIWRRLLFVRASRLEHRRQVAPSPLLQSRGGGPSSLASSVFKSNSLLFFIIASKNLICHSSKTGGSACECCLPLAKLEPHTTRRRWQRRGRRGAGGKSLSASHFPFNLHPHHSALLSWLSHKTTATIIIIVILIIIFCCNTHTLLTSESSSRALLRRYRALVSTPVWPLNPSSTWLATSRACKRENILSVYQIFIDQNDSNILVSRQYKWACSYCETWGNQVDSHNGIPIAPAQVAPFFIYVPVKCEPWVVYLRDSDHDNQPIILD